jgi:hypothetical protein
MVVFSSRAAGPVQAVAVAIQNRYTVDVREAIALIAQRNVERFEEWLDEIAARDPARAAELFLRMLEYHIPRQRAELPEQPRIQVVVDQLWYEREEASDPQNR